MALAKHSRRAAPRSAGSQAPRSIVFAARNVAFTRRHAQQQAVVALTRSVDEEVSAPRQERPVASEPARVVATPPPSANGALQIPVEDRPKTLRNIVFVSSEVGGSPARRQPFASRAPVPPPPPLPPPPPPPGCMHS
jgi:hypothetical protein